MTSINFLKAMYPNGPWVLTAITIDRKKIETRTFNPSTEQEAALWIDKYQNKRNMYFSVNVPMANVGKKTKRIDMEAVHWLHVDVDARAGEPLEEEFERIQALLTDKCPVQPPTVVVFSGGGYQGFWKLAEPILIKGSMEAATEAARYNEQLELIFGADNCHNIDRIMRLPGTMNLPDAKKIEKGRTPTLAEVHLFKPDRVYSIADFNQAPPRQAEDVDPNVTVRINTGSVERLANVDDLDKWQVDDRTKVVIVQGYHPDEPKDGDNSRSAWLFDVCCQLVRKNVPDEVIFSIITDPDFKISESVLDKEGNVDKYATRQIQRAKEEVEEPWLRRLNEKFVVIGNLGGKCRVVEEVYDESMKRTRLTKQSFQDFRNRFSNEYIEVGKKQVTVGHWWLANAKRRQFDYLTFSPGRTAHGAYNLWQGFACKSLPGNKHESFLAHIRNNICSGIQEHYNYLIGWLARAVQQPNSIGETAIVLRGKSGTGKSFFAKHFGGIWGRHFLQVSDAKHLVGSFNAHLRDCVVLFGDEAFFAGDKKHESVLKTLITEERMIIEHKGVDAEVSPNFIHLILASNSDWVVPTGATERRFFMLDVADTHQQDNPYFKRIDEDLSTGGYENLLHFFLSQDLTGFDVRQVPATAALLEQKIHSLDAMHEWWYNRLMEGTLLSTMDYWSNEVLCEDLTNDYIEVCKKYNITRRGGQVKLGMFLRSVCPGTWPKRVRETTGSRKWIYVFPDLIQLRDKWDALYGKGTVWGPEPSSKPAKAPF